MECPDTGKIYILAIVCLVFTALLTSINILTKVDSDQLKIGNDLFGTGIAVNIIQTLFTLYIVYKDVFEGLKDKCVKNYVYYPIFLLSSAYMLSFGIINILKSTDSNDKQEITTVSIASLIAGVVGMLYVITDIICSIGC